MDGRGEDRDTHSENEMDRVTSDDYSTINLKQKLHCSLFQRKLEMFVLNNRKYSTGKWKSSMRVNGRTSYTIVQSLEVARPHGISFSPSTPLTTLGDLNSSRRTNVTLSFIHSFRHPTERCKSDEQRNKEEQNRSRNQRFVCE